MNLVLVSGKSSSLLKVFVGRRNFGNQEVVEYDCREVNLEDKDYLYSYVDPFAITLACEPIFRILDISYTTSERFDVTGENFIVTGNWLIKLSS